MLSLFIFEELQTTLSWEDYGRPRAVKPSNWDEVIAQWKNGEITAVKAMELTGLKKTTFYKLLKAT